MVMGESNIQRVGTHYWVRHEHDNVFHAYESGRAGTGSVCGQASPLPSVREMDIPGLRSKCCARCCVALYGKIGYLPPGEKK